MVKLTRSDFLLQSSQLLALAALAGCTAPSRQGIHRAGCTDVVVSTFGGDYEKLLQAYTDPLVRSQGINVLYDIGEETQHRTKLLVEKPLAKGTLDVVSADDYTAYDAYVDGTLAALDFRSMPYASAIMPQFATPYWVPHIYSGEVILFNPQYVHPAPTSYEVFWDRRYSGRIAMLQETEPYWLRIASVLAGGSATNYEPGKAKLLKLKPLRPKIFASQEDLAAAIRSGDVWLTANWRARGYMWEKGGLPVENVVAREGSVAVLYGGVLAKNAPDKSCALAYLNAMLSPLSQLNFASEMGYNPTVTTASVTPALRKEIGFSQEELKKFFRVNYAYIARNTAAWRKWWQEEFLA